MTKEIIKKPMILRAKAEAPENAQVLETVERALRELFFIRNPQFKKEMPESKEPLAKFLDESGDLETRWIYFPWNNKLVHTLAEDLYFELRTARNRNIITAEEQRRYREAKVGIVGLSVGSNVLWALTVTGGPKVLKIADYDEIEISNLNRLRAPLTEIGANKTEFGARQVWEIDPFAELHLWPQGVNKDTLEEFILGNPKLDIFIDEIDSLELKILARFLCRENKIPVLMATDNGDNIILDLERFDLEPDYPILHGLIGDIKPEDFKTLSYQQWLELATKIVGFQNLTPRMKESIQAIGKTLPAVPQLGSTASIGGAAAAYAVRKIANNQKISSGRYFINLDEKIDI